MLNGYKTYTGIAITILGTLGIAEKLGGTAQLTSLVDGIAQVIGIVITMYGNWHAHKKIEDLK